MIKQILDLLQLDEFYGRSEEIDIAKGLYKIPKTPKELIKQTKRRCRRKR